MKFDVIGERQIGPLADVAGPRLEATMMGSLLLASRFLAPLLVVRLALTT